MRTCLKWVSLSCLFVAAASIVHHGIVRAADGPTKKVLFIGIDGCRTDALLAAKVPNLHGLIENGAFSTETTILPPAARRNKANTVSGPGWSNLLTGVWPDKHGVIDNKFTRPNYREFPHFFARIKQAKPKAYTASFDDWEPIHKFITSGASVSITCHEHEKEDYRIGDLRVTAHAVKCLLEQDPTAIFVYLGNVDETGHKFGFHPKVPRYMLALEQADRSVGDVLEAMRQRPKFAREDWLVVVGTDHGGEGTDHGGGHDKPDVRQVWLIVSGPSAVRGRIEGPTAQVDLVATALTHLGIAISPDWKLDGRPLGLKSIPR